MEDFDGNERVAIKYGAFTLCCNKLLAHHHDLTRRRRGESEFPRDKLWKHFDSVLHDLYASAPTDLGRAVSLVASGLRAKREFVETLSPGVARALNAVIADVEESAPTWQYRQYLAHWQSLGREMAQRFYADSPLGAARERLAREVDLHLEWASGTKRAPFGYRESVLKEGEDPLPGTIVVRFSSEDGFANYLCYPFFFMHEYVSHVYAIDLGSQLFNDGWLLYAAHVLFKRHTLVAPLLGLTDEHLLAFDERIRPHLEDLANQGFSRAMLAEDWLALQFGNFDGAERFRILSCDLAALVPDQDVEKRFHGNFIHAFSECRRTMPLDLRHWLDSSPTVTDLARRLFAAVKF